MQLTAAEFVKLCGMCAVDLMDLCKNCVIIMLGPVRGAHFGLNDLKNDP
jgi:hypothetical protein